MSEHEIVVEDRTALGHKPLLLDGEQILDRWFNVMQINTGKATLINGEFVETSRLHYVAASVFGHATREIAERSKPGAENKLLYRIRVRPKFAGARAPIGGRNV